MKVITLLNEKGGVGKTTLASILAAGLALDGRRVLAVDADGQADLTESMGLIAMGGFYDFAMRPHVSLFNTEHPEYSLIQKIAPDTCAGQLYCVPGNYETYGIASSANTRDLAFALVKRLATVANSFDYVVFDTQPSPTPLHESVLMMTDYVIVPTQAESFSVKNLNKTLEHVTDARQRMQAEGRDKARLLGIVPNMVDTRTWVHREFLDLLTSGDGGDFNGYGDDLMPPVPSRTSIQQAQSIRTFTLHDAPRLRTNDYLWQFIDAVIGRMEGVTA